MNRRLPPRDSEKIDRNQTVEFRFEGQTYRGFAGDVLSSALWAHNVRLLGRSFKYHRPRGIYSLANHDVNVLVEDGQRTNIRADVLQIEAGLDVRAVNTWGGVKRDWLNVTERFSRLMPVGFYYKAFHTPRRLFRFYENQMRKIAGLGKIHATSTAVPSPKDYSFCDLLVVGAGPAGLAAAVAAAEHGVDVLLVDEQPWLGGSFLWQQTGEASSRKRLATLLDQVESLENLRTRVSTQAAGWYADHWIALVNDQHLTKLRSQAMLTATGCFEQPAVFQNNDLPGVMLGSAVQRLLHLYAVKPFERAVVMTANADGYRVALDLHAAGVSVVLVDLRFAGEPSELASRVEELQLEVHTGHAILEALATAREPYVGGALICPLDASGKLQSEKARRIDCDGIAMSVGWMPNVGLVHQAGGRFHFSDQLQQFTPHTLPATTFVAGRANGVFDLEAQLVDGRRAGLEAAARLGYFDGEIPQVPVSDNSSPSHAFPIFSHPQKKNFVDLDEDLHLADFENAHQEGYDNVELLKRYTTVGMGPSQGKLSNMNAARILARLNEASVNDTSTTTARPFHHPVPIGQLAGRRFHPQRRTPLHHWHVERGAEMTFSGAWLRPECYPTVGVGREETILSEAEVIRNQVGMIDVSTLGKIHVRGPDAATFLEHIYTGRFTQQPVGRVRYGLACDETGVIIEDGVIARLAKTHFYVTATTAGAAAFYREMQRWALIFELDVNLVNVTGHLAAISVAGPKSREVLQQITDIDLSAAAFDYLGVREGMIAGAPATILRVGFVGELGFEIHVPASQASHVWETLQDHGSTWGMQPVGVEAQRLLRLEKGHLIVGQDTDALTNPFEADLSWALGKNKTFFVGSRSLEIARRQNSTRRLVGLKLPTEVTRAAADALPKECHLIISSGEIVGRITSLALHSTLGFPIAMGFLRPDLCGLGTRTEIRSDSGKMIEAEVVALPFYDPQNERQAGTSDLQTAQRGHASAPRQSPVFQLLASGEPAWRDLDQTRIAVRYQAEHTEDAVRRQLGLCDLSSLTKLNLQGPDARSWLEAQAVDVPSEIYATRQLADDGWIIQTGRDEFFLESGLRNQSIPTLLRQLETSTETMFSTQREDGSFVLTGSRAQDVLAQTCALDCCKLEVNRLVMTRVAGVSCMLLPSSIDDLTAFRLWMDPSYAVFLWEALAEICASLGGDVVGAAGIFPEFFA